MLMGTAVGVEAEEDTPRAGTILELVAGAGRAQQRASEAATLATITKAAAVDAAARRMGSMIAHLQEVQAAQPGIATGAATMTAREQLQVGMRLRLARGLAQLVGQARIEAVGRREQAEDGLEAALELLGQALKAAAAVGMMRPRDTGAERHGRRGAADGVAMMGTAARAVCVQYRRHGGCVGEGGAGESVSSVDASWMYLAACWRATKSSVSGECRHQITVHLVHKRHELLERGIDSIVVQECHGRHISVDACQVSHMSRELEHNGRAQAPTNCLSKSVTRQSKDDRDLLGASGRYELVHGRIDSTCMRAAKMVASPGEETER
jgi:hypothetical protein